MKTAVEDRDCVCMCQADTVGTTRTMIKHDGGKGDYQELALPMLGIWNSLVKKEAEATWVFLGWEGSSNPSVQRHTNSILLVDWHSVFGKILNSAKPQMEQCCVRLGQMEPWSEDLQVGGTGCKRKHG
eukprot:1158060-Pelagomonas_calceolata.AAC.12